MDDQNEGLRERWGGPEPVPERGYASEEPAVERRPSEIRSDIEQTRADMTETIDAIQEKLRPGAVVSNAAGTVRNATVGKVKQMARGASETLRGGSTGEHGFGGRARGSGLVDRIRENPVPAAVAAVSIAWVALGGRRPRRATSPAIYGSTRGGEPFIRETTIAEYDDERPMADESGGEWRGDEHGGSAARRARSSARDAGRRMREVASSAQSGLGRFVTENPLAAGALAAAVGATVGLSLPETRRENELMGEARDTVVSRARETARDAAGRVQDAAQRVEQVAGEAARKATGEA